MGRPRRTGTGRKRKQLVRVSVDYNHKRAVTDYLDDNHSLDDTVSFFYPALNHEGKRKKKKRFSKCCSNS